MYISLGLFAGVGGLLTLAGALPSTSTSSSSPQAGIHPRSGPGCQIFNFSLTATAQNKVFPLDLSNTTQLTETILDRVFTLGDPFTATSYIAARYCPPVVVIPGREDTLEVLLHSITNNKNFWSGLGPPGQGFQGDAYSWVAFASDLGYHTLALDRLGNGESDHPDPLNVVQGPYEYALYHALIHQIKTGVGSPLPQTFSDVVLIGNSYGSVIIDNILALYPTDVSTAILTGYSKDGIASIPGIYDVDPGPAAQAIPSRFANLPDGYLTTTSVSGRRGAFYGGPPNIDYDTNIFTLDNAVRDVVSLGQFLSNYLDGATVAPAFTGRVLVLTGEEDYAFCGPGNPSLGPAKCGPLLEETGALFPKSMYSWYSVPNTGHSGPFHYSRFVSFGVAHQFIEGIDFAVSG